MPDASPLAVAPAMTDPLDHDGDGRKGGSVKPVWIVTEESGLHQVPTSAVSAAISNGKGRVATPRDLAIAGVTGTTSEEN